MAQDLHLDERPLSKDEIAACADVSTRAFLDDDYFRFLFPSDSMRARSAKILFRDQIRHFGATGRVLTARDAQDQVVGVAVWLSSAHWPPSLGTQLAQLPGSVSAFWRRPRSLKIGAKYLSALLKVHPKEQHWYLLLLGVDPVRQRSGAGTLLMEDVLASVDAQGVGAYLETQDEENLAYYRRFGFELSETLHPMTDGPPYFTMWRPAR